MPRKARKDQPGIHYVTNTGRDGSQPFAQSSDAREFLALVCESCGRYDAQLEGYLIYAGGYELLIRTNRANLSLIMRQIGAVFSRRFHGNHPEYSGGSLWKDRFASTHLLGKKEIVLIYRYWEDGAKKQFGLTSPKSNQFYSFHTILGKQEALECFSTELKEKHIEAIQRGNFSEEEARELAALKRRENEGDGTAVLNIPPLEIKASKNLEKRNKRIRKAFASGYSQTAIAKALGISQSLVSKIINRDKKPD